MTKDIRDKKIMSKMKLLAPEEIFSPEDDRDFHQEDVMKATLILPEEYLAPQTPILNQGTVGSCVAHAIAETIEYHNNILLSQTILGIVFHLPKIKGHLHKKLSLRLYSTLGGI